MKRCLFVAAVFCALQTGCASQPPKGNSGGRVDPYRQTAADRSSKSVSSVTLLEFSDQVSQALAARIPTIPEIAAKSHRVVIEMGAIENQTHSSTMDFRVIKRRMFTTLANNTAITDVAKIVERPELMDAQARRFSPKQSPDLLDEDLGSTQSESARYLAEDTYLLQGSFGELLRGGTDSTYIFDVTLSNLGSREIVFAEQLTSAQTR